MDEKDLKPGDLLKTKKHFLRKPLRAKSASRRLYEEKNPSISIRVDQGTKIKFLLDAKLAGLSEKAYLSSLINDSHSNIEKIRQESFLQGVLSVRKEQTSSLEKAAVDVKQIEAQTRRFDEFRLGIYFRCANHDRGCQGTVLIERNSIHHLEAAVALESQNRFLCKTCELSMRMEKYRTEPPKPLPAWRSSEFYPYLD